MIQIETKRQETKIMDFSDLLQYKVSCHSISMHMFEYINNKTNTKHAGLTYALNVVWTCIHNNQCKNMKSTREKEHHKKS